jgi:hypothetical protein
LWVFWKRGQCLSCCGLWIICLLLHLSENNCWGSFRACCILWGVPLVEDGVATYMSIFDQPVAIFGTTLGRNPRREVKQVSPGPPGYHQYNLLTYIITVFRSITWVFFSNKFNK